MAKNVLQEVRLSKNIKQVEMARLANINEQTYAQYELGYRAIPTAKAKRICEILGIKISDFFVPKYLTLRKDSEIKKKIQTN